MTTATKLTCGICGSRPAGHHEASDDMTAAIDEGWIPSYYEGGNEVDRPTCPDCARVYLRVGSDGEMESFSPFDN